jgi:hypothetical protein
MTNQVTVREQLELDPDHLLVIELHPVTNPI